MVGHVDDQPGESVYFLRAGDKVKVGRARDVAARMKQLQTGNPLACSWRRKGLPTGDLLVPRSVSAPWLSKGRPESTAALLRRLPPAARKGGMPF